MKIEKLTDNKIRIIVNLDDLKEKNIDSKTLINKPAETQNLILDILVKAEKEIGFNTDGCKLLIEAFSSSEGIFVFTITKYKDTSSDAPISTSQNKKKIIVKKKTVNPKSENSIFRFSDFEEFCRLCNYINNINNLNIKKLAKTISLYLYNDTYFLVVSNVNTEYEELNKFYSIISEFATLCSHSNIFESKLFEHGKVIFKKNAISLGIKYFVASRIWLYTPKFLISRIKVWKI